MTRIPITPIELTAGTITEIERLDPNRPHTTPDERGCPDCGEDAYDSGCEAEDCNGWACPDCGTGFVPPERLESGLINRSPVRTQLLELITEAERRAA